MPWNQNFRYNLHCKHTSWYLKLKTKDFSKFHERYPCTFQTTACMHLTLWLLRWKDTSFPSMTTLWCWIEAMWLLFGTCLLFGSCHSHKYEPCLLFGSIVFHNEACVLFGLCWVLSEPCVDKIPNSRQGSVY